jgi:hypothetical protein
VKIVSSFRENVEHYPDLVLCKRLIIDAPKLNVSDQRIFDHLIDNIDDAIGAAIPDLDILMILW